MRKYLFVVLAVAILLPSSAIAGVNFCAPFNTNSNSTLPSVVSPSSFDNSEIDTVTFRAGGGCARNELPSNDWFNIYYWRPFSNLPTNNGRVSFWMKFSAFDPGPFQQNVGEIFVKTIDPLTDRANFIYIAYWAYYISGIPKYRIDLIMRDYTETTVISTSSTETTLSNEFGWHHVELSWLWNSLLGGYTKLYLDGVEVYSSTAGRTKIRSATAQQIEVYGNDYSGYARMDSVTICDDYSSSCDCDAGARRLDFGVPFGSPFGGP